MTISGYIWLVGLMVFFPIETFGFITGVNDSTHKYVFAVPLFSIDETNRCEVSVSLGNANNVSVDVVMQMPGNVRPYYFRVLAMETILVDNHTLRTDLQWKIEDKKPIVAQRKIVIESDKPITVIVEMKGSNGGRDQFYVLPVDQLGHYYMAVCADENPTSLQQIVVVNAGLEKQDIKVEIRYNSRYSNNITATIGIDEAWSFVAMRDMSGTTIISQRPVAVIMTSGHGERTAFQTEMLPPITAWGRRFPVVLNHADESAEFYRLLSAVDNNYFRSDTVSGILGAGQSRFFHHTRNQLVMTDGPALLVKVGYRDGEQKNTQSAFALIPNANQLNDQPVVVGFPIKSRRTAVTVVSQLNSPVSCNFCTKPTRDTLFSEWYGCPDCCENTYVEHTEFVAQSRTFTEATDLKTVSCNGTGFVVIVSSIDDGGVAADFQVHSNWIGHRPETTGIASTTTPADTSSKVTPKVTTSAAESEEKETLTHDLKRLADQRVSTPKEAESLLEKLRRRLDEETHLDMDYPDMFYTVEVLTMCISVDKISNQVKLFIITQIGEKLMVTFFQTFNDYFSVIDTVMSQPVQNLVLSETISNTSSNLLNNFPRLAQAVANSGQMMNGKNLAMAIDSIRCDQGGKGLFESVAGTTNSIENQPRLSQAKAMIYVPNVGFCNSPGSRPSIDRISFIIYRNKKLFQTATGSRRRRSADGQTSSIAPLIKSKPTCGIDRSPATDRVISSDLIPAVDQVRSDDTTTLFQSQPVTMAFTLDPSTSGLHAQAECTFWDGVQWRSDGCQLVESDGDLRVCQCNHLTDFTLIVARSTMDPALCDPALETFSWIMTALAVSSLSAAFVLYLSLECLKYTSERRYLKRGRLTELLHSINARSGILEPLMASVFLFTCLFSLLAESSIFGLDNAGCRVAAAILYTCLLVVICWAAVAGLTFFKSYYVVFDRRILHSLTRRRFGFALSATIPPIITLIIWFANGRFFNREDYFCWIRPDYVGLAILLPLSILIAGDLLLTGLLVKTFFFAPTALAGVVGRKRMLMHKVTILIAVQLTLGFPWVLQYFTIGSPTTTAFNYLFSFAYGSQSILLAGLYILNHVRMIRKRWASCRTSSTNPSGSALSQNPSIPIK